MRVTGARHALAPVLDITSDPRWGRIEETYGEDPYLAAAMGMAYIRGIQGSGAQADPSSFVYGPTAANQSAMMFANTRLPLPEIAPQGANGLAVRAYGAVGTCVMRIWSTGG